METIFCLCSNECSAALGEQDQKIATRFLDIFVASGAKCIYVKEQNILNKNTASLMPT